ncbi:uncharacterized protein JCM15063_005984 [Sporobolomyces koalae]|uniref:uncharacterized protein n=1 Tax=Sporobolomyces koalae TaxID=500713 RepID=UPI0031817494
MLGLGRPSAESNSKASTRHPRQSSGAAYAVFDAKQIQTFKEAFNLIDQDSDGFITETDLKGLLSSLGQTPSPSTIKALLSSASGDGVLPDGKLNFTTFVTLMSNHLSTLDPEPDLLEAFASFDEHNTGFVKSTVLREWLTSSGDRMSPEEVDRLLHAPFVDRHGNFNYRLFCETLRVTEGDEEGLPF